MTKLLDRAFEAARRLDPAAQEEIARALMRMIGEDEDTDAAPLSDQEREAIARSKAAAARGEFATDEAVRSVWAKHGL